MKRFHSAPASGESEPSAKRLRSVPLERSKIACDQCRKRKLKCDDQLPCQSCVTKKLPCTVSANSKRPGRPRAQAVPSPLVENVLLDSLFGAMGSSGSSQSGNHGEQIVGDSITVSTTAEDCISNLQNHPVPFVSQTAAMTNSEQQSGHGSTYPHDATLAIIQHPLLTDNNLLFEGNMYLDQDLGAIMESNWPLPPLVSTIVLSPTRRYPDQDNRELRIGWTTWTILPSMTVYGFKLFRLLVLTNSLTWIMLSL